MDDWRKRMNAMSDRFKYFLIAAAASWWILMLTVPMGIVHMFLLAVIIFCIMLAIFFTFMQVINERDEELHKLQNLAVVGTRMQWRAETDASHHIYSQALSTMPEGNYIYVIRDVDISGNYKIGRASRPARRLYDFDVKLPFEVRIVHVAAVQDAHRTERELHNIFRKKRINGEWFALDERDIDAIRVITENA
jgi:cell division protein FtsL